MKFGTTLIQDVSPPPSHPGDMPEGTLRAILKQVGISVEEFLNA
jgi:hypothetical protein